MSPLVLLLIMELSACNNPPPMPELPYETFKEQISGYRDSLEKVYREGHPETKKRVLKEARARVRGYITQDLFAYWEGTPWTFHGTTEKPREGSIACGYFVTTLLRDAGFHIPRVTWAKLASEQYITQLCPTVKRYRNKELSVLTGELAEGLYVVGLDNHTGFIWKNGDSIRFIHSTWYYNSDGVINEDAFGDNPLNVSAYRVVGQVDSDEVITQWLLGKKY